MRDTALYYTNDPNYQNRKTPFVYKSPYNYQVVVPITNLYKIVAECAKESYANAILEMVTKEQDESK